MGKRKKSSFTNIKRGRHHNQRGGAGRGYMYGHITQKPITKLQSEIISVSEGVLTAGSSDSDRVIPVCVQKEERLIKSDELNASEPNMESFSCSTASANLHQVPEASVSEPDISNHCDEWTSDFHADSCATSQSDATSYKSGNLPPEDLIASNVQSFQSSVVFCQSEVNTEPIVTDLLRKVKVFLPRNWIAIAEKSGLNILLLSRLEELAIQRRIRIAFDGEVHISVHRKPFSADRVQNLIKNCGSTVALESETLGAFVDRAVCIMRVIDTFSLCAGADIPEYKRLWGLVESGTVDNNPYGECRFNETLRSNACTLLVKPRSWRCKQCNMIVDILRKKDATHKTDEWHPNTANVYLDQGQKLKKLQCQKKNLKNAKRKIDRLQVKVALAIKTEGVFVNNEIAESLADVMKEERMTPLQELFIQQQVKAASVKSPTGMRWHPAMIRLALLLKTTSNAAYNALRDSGFVRLPCDRTLYDYTKVMPEKEGCHAERMDQLGKQVSEFKEPYQKYHNLLMDEMHISKKLVFQKSSGEMIGYVKLFEVESEIKELEDSMKNVKSEIPLPEATKMLTYMIKGTATNVKEVVASYTTDSSLSKEQLHDRTWEVINCLEIAGVKIVSLVCDGSATNRAFINMHIPVTITKSGVIFDTINRSCPERVLYFISDPPHLLKTIRNCFARSGHDKKCTRILTKNGQEIVWKTISRLFLTDRHDTLRRCYKLNAHNVFLNSFSCMKVAYAAQVMSATVAMDLKSRNWDNTSETVQFLLKVNNFFDCLNGASTEQAKRKANDRLSTYKNCNDERFEELLDFLKYLDDWSSEVENLRNVSAALKAKRLLSKQTLIGIEMTIRSFICATKFLLKEGQKYVNARIFCQDPLEQYFSKQRSSHGGKSNPNVCEFLSAQNKISIHRTLTTKRHSGNTEGSSSEMQLTGEPLMKIKKSSVSSV